MHSVFLKLVTANNRFRSPNASSERIRIKMIYKKRDYKCLLGNLYLRADHGEFFIYLNKVQHSD